MIGTALGAFLGWATYYALARHYVLYGVAVAICAFACSLLRFDKAGRLPALALTILVLVHLDDGPGRAAVARFLEVALGIVVTLAVTLLLLPDKPQQSKLDAYA